MSLVQGHFFHCRYTIRQFVNPPGGDECSQNQFDRELCA